METKVKCRYCKKSINKKDAYSVKDRVYFCNESCYNDYYTKTDEGQLDMFLDYVWNLYDSEYRTSEKYMMIRKQAEYYHNEYGFKYKGMLLATRWYIETLERVWHNEYGLGQILPDRYIQLKNYYEEQKALKDKLLNTDNNIIERTVSGHKRGRMLSLE